MPRRSAGLLLYRRAGAGLLEVLLAHPGGPFWARRDDGAWTLPKGEIEPGEDPLGAACREFREETGFNLPSGAPIPLGECRQRGGKVVIGFGLAGHADPAALRSNVASVEWPPRSGRSIEVPEIDRVAWLGPVDARRRINPAQAVFLDRLDEAVLSQPRARTVATPEP